MSQKHLENKRKLTRKERKALTVQFRSDNPGLEVVHADAAGIDIGNDTHYVAVAPDRDPEPVRSFACFTEDLRRMALWLKKCGVRSVAMQSTGVYWIPVYDVLEEAGLEVYLVNARHTKSLPGRKSDVQECQWLLKLHTFGLLNHSYRPAGDVLVLRALWRQRSEHVQALSQSIQRMQKALTEMNLQLANVISDISGVTGQAIIRRILAGERDPRKLAQMRDYRIKASEETIAKSLEGNWRRELLFILQQQVDIYDGYQKRIAECDRQLEKELKELPTQEAREAAGDQTEDQTGEVVGEEEKPKRRKTKKKQRPHAPGFDLQTELHRISGVDLTRIDGVDVMTAQTVMSEIGCDVSRWKTEGRFVSWLGLCPDNQISGGKVLQRRTRHVVNRLATALRISAWSLLRSQSYLGAQYRRLRTRLGAPKAITAMAARLARLIHRMLTYGQEYVDKGMSYYESRHAAQQLRFLNKKANEAGWQLVPASWKLTPAEEVAK
jgi:transposase